MSPRDAFLRRVREAAQEGNRAGTAPPPAPRGEVGYQGAGTDPAQRFCAELTAAGGKAYVAADAEAAWLVLVDVVRAKAARRILVGRGGVLDRLDVAGRLRAIGVEVQTTDTLPAETSRASIFAAEVGVSTAYRLIAETGTVVLASSPTEPRGLSLLPPVHVVLAERQQLLPDLFDLFDLFSPTAAPEKSLPPSCLSLITGPSKTGDIELRLVTGVHGPGEVHVILI